MLVRVLWTPDPVPGGNDEGVVDSQVAFGGFAGSVFQNKAPPDAFSCPSFPFGAIVPPLIGKVKLRVARFAVAGAIGETPPWSARTPLLPSTPSVVVFAVSD